MNSSVKISIVTHVRLIGRLFSSYAQNGLGISGALANGDVFRPSIDGVFLYLQISDLSEARHLVQ